MEAARPKVDQLPREFVGAARSCWISSEIASSWRTCRARALGRLRLEPRRRSSSSCSRFRTRSRCSFASASPAPPSATDPAVARLAEHVLCQAVEFSSSSAGRRARAHLGVRLPAALEQRRRLAPRRLGLAARPPCRILQLQCFAARAGPPPSRAPPTSAGSSPARRLALRVVKCRQPPRCRRHFFCSSPSSPSSADCASPSCAGRSHTPPPPRCCSRSPR